MWTDDRKHAVINLSFTLLPHLPFSDAGPPKTFGLSGAGQDCWSSSSLPTFLGAWVGRGSDCPLPFTYVPISGQNMVRQQGLPQKTGVPGGYFEKPPASGPNNMLARYRRTRARCAVAPRSIRCSKTAICVQTSVSRVEIGLWCRSFFDPDC